MSIPPEEEEKEEEEDWELDDSGFDSLNSRCTCDNSEDDEEEEEGVEEDADVDEDVARWLCFNSDRKEKSQAEIPRKTSGSSSMNTHLATVGDDAVSDDEERWATCNGSVNFTEDDGLVEDDAGMTCVMVGVEEWDEYVMMLSVI